MKITIFYDGSWYTFKWLKPLLWVSQEFAQQGIKVEFYNAKEYLPKGDRMNNLQKAANSNERFDIIFLAYHSTSTLGSADQSTKLEIITKLKNKSNKVVWLDTADSTGTPQFEVLPVVDLYLKKQVCADMSEYSQKLWWGGRNYCQYFHEKYHTKDNNLENLQYVSAPNEFIRKIRVSWNVGLADLWGNKYISYLFREKKKIPYYFSPSSMREYDVHYRGTVDSSTIGIQRRLCFDILNTIQFHFNIPDLSGKVPHKIYIEEISKSKCILSPFGYGEVCTRDFESFVYGACLIKPDVSHMVTYPSWYIADETYIPVNWDISDLEEKLEYILTENRYLKIARQGQELYKKEQSSYGKKRFVDHIMSILA